MVVFLSSFVVIFIRERWFIRGYWNFCFRFGDIYSSSSQSQMSDVLRYYGLGVLACSGSELISETTSLSDICDFLERDWLIAKTSMFTEYKTHRTIWTYSPARCGIFTCIRNRTIFANKTWHDSERRILKLGGQIFSFTATVSRLLLLPLLLLLSLEA